MGITVNIVNKTVRRKKRPAKDESERFWSKVDTKGNDPNQCWEWKGSLDTGGYSQFKNAQGILEPAHRWVMRNLKDGYPEGTETDHTCNNRGCVKPDHLEAVTHAENIARREERKKANRGKLSPRQGEENQLPEESS